MIVYLSRNRDPDNHFEFIDVDESASDDEYWRGYTFDNHWTARSKSEYRIVSGFNAAGDRTEER